MISLEAAALFSQAAPGGRNVLYFFERFSLDEERRQLRKDADTVVSLEPQVFDLLTYLVKHRDRVVSKDEIIQQVWNGRIVSDSTLDSRLNAVRKALDDSGKEQRLVRTFTRKGVRFVGAVKERPIPSSTSIPVASADSVQPPQSASHQEIRYCRTRSGIQIAYAACGEGSTIVKTATWLSHLEYEWDSPIWRHWIEALSAGNRLIRYDERGNGLSDWRVDDMSFEAMLADLEDVADAAGADRFALLGISQGCAISVAYAVRHPERVSHLVLYGGFVQGWRAAGNADQIARWTAMTTLIRQGWGRNNPAFRQVFTSLFVPGASQEQMDWFNELQRKSVSPDNAAKLNEAIGDFDVSDLLPHVRIPTLVLHSRNDAVCPYKGGRRFATEIPGARFVMLESDNHILLAHEPAFHKFVEEMRRFIAGDESGSATSR